MVLYEFKIDKKIFVDASSNVTRSVLHKTGCGRYFFNNRTNASYCPAGREVT